LTFTVNDLQKIIALILPGSNRKFSLIGFSLGGRVALALFEAMPSRVEKMILLAPDGLKVNFWYWLSTQTLAGNRLFAFTMKYPGWFFALLKILNKLKFVNASIFKFVNFYIGDKEVRRLLYARWTSMRKLKPGLPRIRSLVLTNQTQVRLLYGKHDRIILPARGQKFIKGIEKFCTLSLIRSGHQVLAGKHVQQIVQALLH